MRAMILAAGRGLRMRPLSDTTPKALLPVGGRALIEWQVLRLVAGGFDDIVVNHAWLGEQIVDALGDGAKLGACIRHSAESPALETAGGIARALPLLGDQPFVAVSADVHTAFDYGSLRARVEALAEESVQGDSPVAHLVLTDNPAYHPTGDMALHDGFITLGQPRLTYANIAVFRPGIFAALDRDAPLKLFPWLYQWVERGQVSGEYFHGDWSNVGSPDDLHQLDATVRARQPAPARIG